MKIAVFIKSTTFHKNSGGLESQNKVLVEGLARAGFNVTVFSTQLDSMEEFREENGVRYRFLNLKFSNLNKISEKVFLEFKKYHLEERFDVAISQSSFGLGVIRRKKELGIKVLTICHGSAFAEFISFLSKKKNLDSLLDIPKNFIYTIFKILTSQKEFILNSDKVICVSNFVKKNISKETGVSENLLSVIYNGVSHSNQIFERKEKIILYVGRVEEEKGVSDLVEIFNKSIKEKFPEFKMKILGTGSYLTQLKKEISDLQLENRVITEGFKNENEIRSIMSSSYVFVFPTRRVEGFPMTIVESLISGLPVIAIDKGGVSEGVINGITGILCKNKNEFEENLIKFLENEDELTKLSKSAKEYAINNFTSDIMVERYKTELLKLI